MKERKNNKKEKTIMIIGMDAKASHSDKFVVLSTPYYLQSKVEFSDIFAPHFFGSRPIKLLSKVVTNCMVLSTSCKKSALASSYFFRLVSNHSLLLFLVNCAKKFIVEDCNIVLIFCNLKNICHFDEGEI